MAGISKRYPGVLALDDASLSINTGEIVGLVGKNGAGKSTLIKVLAGLEAPDSGTFFIHGDSVGQQTARSIGKAGIHFVFQELEEFPDLTVADNVLIGTRPPRVGRFFLSNRRLRMAAAEHLARINCNVAPQARMSLLSTAERRQVMVARALAGRVRLLVLDEPTASLTPREVAEILAVCRELRRAGASILYVSHRLSEVLQIADRVVVMRDGRTVSNQPREVLTVDHLVDIISGEPRRSASPVADVKSAAHTPPSAATLAVQNLGDGRRFTGVTFTAKPGQVVGLAGLVGAGRTEVANAIVGAAPWTTGSLVYDGRRVRFRTVTESLRQGIVLLPEDRRRSGIVANYSVLHNATLSSLRRFRLFRPVSVVSGRKERSAVLPLLKQLTVRTAGTGPMSTLSGGNQQKVLTIRAMLTASQVIILDEPTAGIDVAAKEEIYSLIESLKSAGAALIVISSEFAELERLCDSVVVLAHGRQVALLDGPRVPEEEITRLCYSGEAAHTPDA